jgi:hypothetical protein
VPLYGAASLAPSAWLHSLCQESAQEEPRKSCLARYQG